MIVARAPRSSVRESSLPSTLAPLVPVAAPQRGGPAGETRVDEILAVLVGAIVTRRQLTQEAPGDRMRADLERWVGAM